MIHRYFGIHFNKKILFQNVWKVFFTVGVSAAAYYKTDVSVRINERNPYGNATATVNAYKKFSYKYDMYQDVKLIKEKYSNQNKNTYHELILEQTQERDQKLYSYFMQYLRDYPQECFD